MPPIDFEGPFLRDPEALADSAERLLLRSANLWKRESTRVLRQSGLTPTQEQVLGLLVEVRQGRAVRAADLARALRLNPILVASLVRTFEARGYLRRLPDPADARSSLLEVTGEGRQKHQEANEALRRFAQGFFKPLEHSVPVLQKLLRNLLRAHDPLRELSKSVRERKAKAQRSSKASSEP